MNSVLQGADGGLPVSLLRWPSGGSADLVSYILPIFRILPASYWGSGVGKGGGDCRLLEGLLLAVSQVPAQEAAVRMAVSVDMTNPSVRVRPTTSSVVT